MAERAVLLAALVMLGACEAEEYRRDPVLDTTEQEPPSLPPAVETSVVPELLDPVSPTPDSPAAFEPQEAAPKS